MALRFLLVGLVIGLGFEMPKGEQISSWARAGSDWIQSRIDDLLGPGAVAESEPANDSDFEAIVDQMASTFSADLARVERTSPRGQLVVEPIEVPEDVEPGIAYALNRGSQGEGSTPEVIAPEIVKAPRPEPETVETSRSSRIVSAVRLTREAASAWWTVIRGVEAATVTR